MGTTTTASSETSVVLDSEQTDTLEEEALALLETSSDASSSSSDVTYNDGTYTGVADGYGADLTVEVVIDDGLITEITIVSHNEHEERFYEPAMETVPDEIIASQSIEVDSVSGSTFTSIGIKNAVADALSQAIATGELPETEELPASGGHHGGGGGNRGGH